MSGPVENLVELLRAKRSGKGWLAKCPAHDDSKPSLSIDEGIDGRALIKCHAGCSTDNVIGALGLTKRDLFPATITHQHGNGAAPAKMFDWRACVEAFSDKHIERLAKWRGYSIELCLWLKAIGFVGLHDGCIAFPVHDGAGNVIAAHYRLKDGSWRYYPQGAKLRLLIIGELVAGDPVHVFESQWDAFAFMGVSGERSGIIITRSASNGALVADVTPQSATLYAWPQNDAAGEKWQKDISANTKATVKRAEIPASHKDLNDWTRAGATVKELLAAITGALVLNHPERPRPLIEFKTPSQLKNFIPPPGIVLVGDCHIVRGLVFVIGGAPGVGKSRAAVALAEAGATGKEWFGLTVHRKFKVMIVQTENGEFRLSREFAEMDCDTLENFVRVCPPPPYGLCFERDGFREQLTAAVADFAPDVVVYDPWNAAAREQDSREYLDTFDALRSVLPVGDDAPALGILAHTRKPRADERGHAGRGLLNVLAGSYVLGSVPRCVFVMQLASDDPQDNRVVWTCCKNNDGELGARSAWERRNGLFAPVSDFDWETFDNPRDERVSITADDLAEIFDNGTKQSTRTEAVKALRALTGAGRTACYDALRPDGRFAKQLRETDGLLSWKP